MALLYFGRHLFVTVAFALFLAFAMRPFVSLLERAGVPRVIAILLLIFLLVGAVVLLVINVTAQANELYQQLPRYQVRIRELVSNVMEFVDRLRERMGSILSEDARGVREVKISESPLSTTRAVLAQRRRHARIPAVRRGGPLHHLLHAEGPGEVRPRHRGDVREKPAVRQHGHDRRDLAEDDVLRRSASPS